MSQSCCINDLDPKCRVCRVFLGVERPQEFLRAIRSNSPIGENLGTDSARGGVWTPIGLQVRRSKRSTLCRSLRYLVGPPRFELGTSCTPSKIRASVSPPFD